LFAPISFSVTNEECNVTLVLHQLWNLLMQSHETRAGAVSHSFHNCYFDYGLVETPLCLTRSHWAMVEVFAAQASNA
jgi:hypothetical protein